MRHSISNTAEYGDMTRGPRVIGDETREAMRKILADIQSGEFAKEWIAENQAGGENFDRMRYEAAGPPDRAGRRRPAGDDALDQEEEDREQSRYPRSRAPPSCPPSCGTTRFSSGSRTRRSTTAGCRW